MARTFALRRSHPRSVYACLRPALEGAAAVFYNGLGRYKDALGAAKRSFEHPDDLVYSTWAAVELIEAAARSGVPEQAASALERLQDSTHASGTDWALGTEACSRALLSDEETAEHLYCEALERLGRTRIRLSLARAQLVYGEWLRRECRPTDAREQLRTAHEMFVKMGAEGFAVRAGGELLASGDYARKRVGDTSSPLTAQETQVARLARDDLSNAEIAARLFISRRTVQYHLRKVFVKLGIKSRQQLDRVLPSGPDVSQQGPYGWA